MLSKFPVTSDKRVYLVKFEEHRYLANTYDFYLYISKKMLFGLKRMKKVAEMYYEGKDWDYNFVDMAEFMVHEYERKSEEKKNIKKAATEGIESFRKWNGNITSKGVN